MFSDDIQRQLSELAQKYRTTVDKLIARAVATEVFFDRLPSGSKILVLTPDGRYQEVMRPDLRDVRT
jgi:hypothetical protein